MCYFVQNNKPTGAPKVWLKNRFCLKTGKNRGSCWYRTSCGLSFLRFLDTPEISTKLLPGYHWVLEPAWSSGSPMSSRSSRNRHHVDLRLLVTRNELSPEGCGGAQHARKIIPPARQWTNQILNHGFHGEYSKLGRDFKWYYRLYYSIL